MSKICMLYRDDGHNTYGKDTVQLWPKRVVADPTELHGWEALSEVENAYDTIKVMPSRHISHRGQGAKVIQAQVFVKELNKWGRFDLRAESLVDLIHSNGVTLENGLLKGNFGFHFKSSSYHIGTLDNIEQTDNIIAPSDLIPMHRYKTKKSDVVYLGSYKNGKKKYHCMFHLDVAGRLVDDIGNPTHITENCLAYIVTGSGWYVDDITKSSYYPYIDGLEERVLKNLAKCVFLSDGDGKRSSFSKDEVYGYADQVQTFKPFKDLGDVSHWFEGIDGTYAKFEYYGPKFRVDFKTHEIRQMTDTDDVNEFKIKEAIDKIIKG